jgi:hypothetical protein
MMKKDERACFKPSGKIVSLLSMAGKYFCTDKDSNDLSFCSILSAEQIRQNKAAVMDYLKYF